MIIRSGTAICLRWGCAALRAALSVVYAVCPAAVWISVSVWWGGREGGGAVMAAPLYGVCSEIR